MADKYSTLTQDLLKELFDYKDGELYWKLKPAIRVSIGDIAGSLSSNGYKQVYVNSKPYLNHRIIFAMHNGFFPKQIDHIDGNPLNNKIENLREVTNTQNAYNKKCINKYGIKGISLHKKTGKYHVRLTTNGKQMSFGLYEKIEDAKNAAIKARQELHGEFARFA
jgi:hypothetical protein